LSPTTLRCCSPSLVTPRSARATSQTRLGITERAAQRIVADLAEAGYVETTRVGRRNDYTVNGEVSMRHPAQHNHEIGALLDVLKLDEE
jgi:hypothetical protein